MNFGKTATAERCEGLSTSRTLDRWQVGTSKGPQGTNLASTTASTPPGRPSAHRGTHTCEDVTLCVEQQYLLACRPLYTAHWHALAVSSTGMIHVHCIHLFASCGPSLGLIRMGAKNCSTGGGTAAKLLTSLSDPDCSPPGMKLATAVVQTVPCLRQTRVRGLQQATLIALKKEQHVS